MFVIYLHNAVDGIFVGRAGLAAALGAMLRQERRFRNKMVFPKRDHDQSDLYGIPVFDQAHRRSQYDRHQPKHRCKIAGDFPDANSVWNECHLARPARSGNNHACAYIFPELEDMHCI